MVHIAGLHTFLPQSQAERFYRRLPVLILIPSPKGWKKKKKKKCLVAHVRKEKCKKKKQERARGGRREKCIEKQDEAQRLTSEDQNSRIYVVLTFMHIPNLPMRSIIMCNDVYSDSNTCIFPHGFPLFFSLLPLLSFGKKAPSNTT
ncbi:hypothetical protein POVWA2_039570 [Plasmodium ovale wallikeri]|uniref:Uncharacterized protein n=1 Tax=Plasmodium ovale wallikeri TaxID=864142 RepID=A0A1A8Z7X9_PLAOA|nr:hypothetical protein POVWA1_041000 [Plasmodium ovale wallikeri]SBT40337.1 hypothetical protein POVWA2_039570 [Plasmodium ovale wallikeri]